MSGLRRELTEAKSIAARASATWDKFRMERDFHRMHHTRVAQVGTVGWRRGREAGPGEGAGNAEW